MGVSEDTLFRKRAHQRRRHRRPPRIGKQMGGGVGTGGNQTLGRMDMYGQYTDPYNEDIMHRQMGGISSTKSIAGRGGMGGAGNQTFEYDIADCVRAGFRGEMAKICAQGIHHQHME